VSARREPELNALFERRDGWTGADGAYSVPLVPGRSLWLFSDTWVGKVKDGKRFDATMVNNSAAVLEWPRPDAAAQFFVRRGADGKALALITPKMGGGWFWLQAAALDKNRLYLFLSQLERTNDSSVFGFRGIGQWLGVVNNPHDPPTSWRVQQLKLPFALYTPQREITFGAALHKDGEFVYIYGVDDVRQGLFRSKHVVLARAPLTSVADFSSWRFYQGGQWTTEWRKADRLADGVANEYSVSYLRALKNYVLVYTEGGMSPRILARTAPQPWGPWSTPTVLYQCPEAGWDKKIFCYAAKAHPELTQQEDELVITYVANSLDFWQVAADARLYWPRFIRVTVRAKEER